MTSSDAFWLDKVLDAIRELRENSGMEHLAARLTKVIQDTPIAEMM